MYDIRLGNAVEEAKNLLPSGWQITVTIVRGCVSVQCEHPDYDLLDYEDRPPSDAIRDALLDAIEVAKEEVKP